MAGSVDALLAELPPGRLTLWISAGRCQANYCREGSSGWAVVTKPTACGALTALLDQEVNGHPVFRQDDVEELL